MSKELLEDLKEEIEILTGYKIAYKEAIEQNKRYREVIKKAIDDLWDALVALKELEESE